MPRVELGLKETPPNDYAQDPRPEFRILIHLKMLESFPTPYDFPKPVYLKPLPPLNRTPTSSKLEPQPQDSVAQSICTSFLSEHGFRVLGLGFWAMGFGLWV